MEHYKVIPGAPKGYIVTRNSMYLLSLYVAQVARALPQSCIDWRGVEVTLATYWVLGVNEEYGII